MSIHRSLFAGGLVRRRSVLTRAERIDKLRAEGQWSEEEDSVLGLPKVRTFWKPIKRKKLTDEELGIEPIEGLEGVEAEEGAEVVEEAEEAAKKTGAEEPADES